MEFKRLWQTLTFFEVFPVFTCLKKVFNLNLNQKQSLSMNYILLSENQSSLFQETITQLKQKQIPYRILATETLNNESLSVTLLQGVDKIICFPQNNIDKLIELVTQNLKPRELILTCFNRQNQSVENIWGAVDDVVMGGVSNSNLILKETTALFTGKVSTDNNGGFVSVRTKNFSPPWDLSDYQGIRLRVKGDGQRYKFITRGEGKWDGISYCYSFDTIADLWMTIDIPFNALIPVFRAKTVYDADKFNSKQVYSLQLMLSKFEYDGGYNPTFRAGLFSLEIESIKAYGKDDSPQLILMDDPKLWTQYKIQSQLLTIYAKLPDEVF